MNNHLVPPCLCVLNEALLLVVLRANVLRGWGVRGRVREVALLVNSETTNIMFENKTWSEILSKCPQTYERIAGLLFSRCSQWEEFWRHRTGRPLVAPPFSFQIESLPAKLSCSSHRGEVKAFGHIGGWSDPVRKRLLLTEPDKMSYFYFTNQKWGRLIRVTEDEPWSNWPEIGVQVLRCISTSPRHLVIPDEPVAHHRLPLPLQHHHLAQNPRARQKEQERPGHLWQKWWKTGLCANRSNCNQHAPWFLLHPTTGDASTNQRTSIPWKSPKRSMMENAKQLKRIQDELTNSNWPLTSGTRGFIQWHHLPGSHPPFFLRPSDC